MHRRSSNSNNEQANLQYFSKYIHYEYRNFELSIIQLNMQILTVTWLSNYIEIVIIRH